MGIPGSANLMLLGGGAQAYQIEQSLRFDGAASLTRTQATPTNGNIVTVSAWIKKTTNQDFQGWMGADAGTSTSGAELKFNAASNSQISLYNEYTNGTRGVYFESDGKYRDPSAWMHVVSVYQNTSTPSDSPTYVNGVQITGTSGSGGSNPGAGWGDAAPQWNMSGVIQSVGSCTTTAYRLRYLHGYLAEVIQVDGQALDQYDFGEFDDNGVWRPIEYTGTYGNNGFYLKFDPSATNGIGHDHSGNGNNFTPSGFTTSGTGTDVMSDTPTTNWCTLNPLDAAANNGLADGNLKCGTTTAANTTSIRGTQAVSSGKWYFEVQKITTGTINIQCGWAATSLAHTFDTSDTGVYGKAISGTTVMIAADFDNNAIWTGVDGTWDNSATTAEIEAGTTTNATHTSVANYPLAPMFLDQAGSFSGEANFNFGQRDFAYTPPTGFNALNTSNFPAPGIKDGSDNFNTVLYTGTNSTLNITGATFQPDLVWIKERSSTATHNLIDAVRGARIHLSTNLSDGDYTEGAGKNLTSFDSDGFTLGTDNSGPGRVNSNGQTYVAWNWLAGNGTSSNTAGDITSTVSANPSAGFSIVSWTSDAASSVRTMGHGLGDEPTFIVVKNRDVSDNWYVWHQDLPAKTYALYFTSDQQQSFGSTTIWSTSSTTFGIRQSSIATGTQDCIAYCFAEIEGFSKFGSYTGNGSSDGPFVYTGFKPAFVMIKVTDQATTHWMMRDDKRDTDNPNSAYLLPSSSLQEYTNLDFDFLSNGFKLRHTNGVENVSGKKYVFVAFASSPFGGSGVSPATAR